ncbi:hypothetical protein ABZ589_17650 [Streptomyces sp. NPDC013313]|uniref:NADPH-dependent F420 reductase n=1 Tax=Streptomyces sp. NPDC013313 TaxID=3155603 RepID=UPI0033FF0F6F
MTSIVVDISDPVDLTTLDSLVVPPGTSAAEQFATAAPESRVVKAFNTTFAGPLTSGQVAGRPLDVFIAGDDDAAKQAVTDRVSSAGLRPLDVGPLRCAGHASWKPSDGSVTKAAWAAGSSATPCCSTAPPWP